MTDAEWVRNLANRHKDTLTVTEHERLCQIAHTLEGAAIDAAIVEAITQENGVELTYAPALEDGWATFTARKGTRVGYSHQFNGHNVARNALVGFSRAPRTAESYKGRAAARPEQEGAK